MTINVLTVSSEPHAAFWSLGGTYQVEYRLPPNASTNLWRRLVLCFPTGALPRLTMTVRDDERDIKEQVEFAFKNGQSDRRPVVATHHSLAKAAAHESGRTALRNRNQLLCGRF